MSHSRSFTVACSPAVQVHGAAKCNMLTCGRPRSNSSRLLVLSCWTAWAEDLERWGTSSTFLARAAGKKSHNRQFEDYGDSYGQNDVVGCLLDCNSHSISYFKNGASLGVAFQVHMRSEHVIGCKMSDLAHVMLCEVTVWC